MKPIKKKINITIGLGCAVIAAAVILSAIKHTEPLSDGTGHLQIESASTAYPTVQFITAQTAPESSASPEVEPSGPWKGKSRLKNITVDKNIYVSEVYDELNIYAVEPIIIDADTGNAFTDNLSEHGWTDHDFKAADIPGLYFIGSKERGNMFDSEEKAFEACEHFMWESGLETFLEAFGFHLRSKMEGSDGCYTQLYRLGIDNQITNSYVRINLESNSICGECKMYLCENTVIGKLPSIPFAEAVENAFYPAGELPGSMEWAEMKVNDAALEYFNGLPYYSFRANVAGTRGAVTGYAPAVSFDEIAADKTLLDKFINFS